jgi:class 3 adenylate cyclase
MLAELSEPRPSEGQGRGGSIDLSTVATPARGCQDERVENPDVRYARSGGIAIAYQSIGAGPPVVYAPHLCSIDQLWTARHTSAFLTRLAQHVQLIVFNPRGTGLSDRPRGITLESRMDDINAVLEATKHERVTLFGVAESANACALFASTFPERCERLVLFTPYASIEESEEERIAWIREMREHWGDRLWMEGFAGEINPLYRDDPEIMDWFVGMQRAAASPGAAADFARMQMETDITDVLPTIKVPTVVAHRALDRHIAQNFAEKILDASLVEMPGEGLDPYEGALADLIVQVAHRDSIPAVPDSMLATLLFTDLTDSTVMAAKMGDQAWRALLAQHHADVRRELARYRGIEVDSAGDGFFCRFDGPARAIDCAMAILDGAKALGLEVRAGLHTGECELVGPKPAGIAVHIGARVLGVAEPGEVLVSRTVTDLVAGSGNTFLPRGEHTLKGVPGTWALFAVER